MKKIYLLLLLAFAGFYATAQQRDNFSKTGRQLTRFDDLGRAVDAHDGEIAYFNGTYYLYGTSYDCGFEWNNKTAPFCGFKCYTSRDMITWKEEGYLFDAKTALWQSRCDGKTYGCFRPHVVYNPKNKDYVLWINVYDNVSGYRVFTAKNPAGPFSEVAEPKLAVNSTMPAAGLNNGDHDLFIDDDGKGYLAFTDWRTNGTIVIEQLTDDYLSGNGNVVRGITAGQTEAPALFKRKGIYYMTYSDPNCGYCPGTGTSYKTAGSPMGPWSEGRKISENSCGGQPSFVSAMKVGTETVYLYGSDLWNNAAKNEAQANFYWAPLTFAADGSINPLDCLASFAVPKGSGTGKPVDASDGYTAKCDIGQGVQHAQLFTATRSGKIRSFDITTLKSGYPDRDLKVIFYPAVAATSQQTLPLLTVAIPERAIGWSAKKVSVDVNLKVIKGQQYLVVLSSETTKGCYGFAWTETSETDKQYKLVSKDNGLTFIAETGKKLKLDVRY